MVKKKMILSRIALILLFIIFFLFYLGFPFNTSLDTTKHDSSHLYQIPGLSVLVKSSENWDLFEYLCKEGDSCQETPTSGKRFSTISGGEDREHEVVIDQAEEWSDYSYVKLFVRPAVGSPNKVYKVENNALLPQARVEVIGQGNNQVEALLIPVSEISNSYYEMAATFGEK
jgi:hypothetical protein